MLRCLPLAVAMLLAGCGVDVEPPAVSTAQDIRDRTLARIKTVEDQLAAGKPMFKDIRGLMVSVKYLYGHMTTQKVGTDEQRNTLTAIHEALEMHYGGPRNPAVRVDTQALAHVLPKLRQTVESIR
ncbi:MAG TPA: hypothetical protein VMZ92_11120 [Planctomycetota bacterium]|nr:hypothetical protein [Planctomycetota bacterium]